MKRLRPVLVVAPSVEETWNDAIAPWFERVVPGAWQHPLPSLVVGPTRGHLNDLKERLIANGSSHLGLQFVTPVSLRALLSRNDKSPAARPENLWLLLAIAANEMEERPNQSEALAAKAVTRAPAFLLRALDRLQTAGWKFEDLALPSFAPVVQRFNELLKESGFSLPGEADRGRLQNAADARQKSFSHVLITGFSGAHWADWFLLRGLVAMAENATIVVEEPRENLTDIDLCWIGSWEEVCGEARRATKPALSHGDSLFSEAEMRGRAGSVTRFDFLIGANVSEQAEAVTRQCLRYLAEEKCTRLGVIFPRHGALPRLVANSLASLGVPHNDGFAHPVPGIFESAEMQAWMELQRSPRLASLLRFLNSLRDFVVLSPKLSRSAFENVLRESYNELLVDDLEILGEYCLRRPDERFQLVGQALRAFPLLPLRATLAQFVEKTETGLAYLGWRQHAFDIANAARDWSQHLNATFSRALFLRWLEEIAVTFGLARSDSGDHPYARVQLLAVSQPQNQEWSHLILAGWNEGAWPPPPGAEFARADEIRAFNRSVQQLNRRAACTGSQGEGHLSVSENHSLYLGPIEQRTIALQQFDALLESATEAATLAASLMQEDAPERFWNPSECFTQLYLKTRGEPLTQKTLKNLQLATARWLKDSARLKQNGKRSVTDARQTLIAFKARRDSSKPASEYDFALRPQSAYRPMPTLSVSDFEGMVSTPAIVWMKRYLGVEPPDNTANPWIATTGKWVHQWLAGISNAKNGSLFGAFPSATIIDKRVSLSADECRTALRSLCDSLGKTVPDWWNSGWLNARYLARYLGAKIASAQGWDWMATELRIGGEDAVKLNGKTELRLRGQIDLVLAKGDKTDFAGQSVWIVDYKTGSARELRLSDLHDSLVKGTALQLALYALAVRQLGAAEVDMSILSLAVKSAAPQLTILELEPYGDLFADLATMQRSGVFGMKGEVRRAFGYSATYPLATLQIDNDILEDKWALSHPALVLEKEEWETW